MPESPIFLVLAIGLLLQKQAEESNKTHLKDDSCGALVQIIYR